MSRKIELLTEPFFFYFLSVGKINLIKLKLMNIDLRLGDCLEILKEVKDKTVDMVFCDLP
jgi:predicted methyltransferase